MSVLLSFIYTLRDCIENIDVKIKDVHADINVVCRNGLQIALLTLCTDCGYESSNYGTKEEEATARTTRAHHGDK